MLEHIPASLVASLGLASLVEEPSWRVHNILVEHKLEHKLALPVVAVEYNSLIVDIEQGKCI